MGISFQEMAFPLQSPGHKNTIHTPFKGPKHIDMIDLTAAGELDDPDIG
jgi:hypothetical protein